MGAIPPICEPGREKKTDILFGGGVLVLKKSFRFFGFLLCPCLALVPCVLCPCLASLPYCFASLPYCFASLPYIIGFVPRTKRITI